MKVQKAESPDLEEPENFERKGSKQFSNMSNLYRKKSKRKRDVPKVTLKYLKNIELNF